MFRLARFPGCPPASRRRRRRHICPAISGTTPKLSILSASGWIIMSIQNLVQSSELGDARKQQESFDSRLLLRGRKALPEKWRDSELFRPGLALKLPALSKERQLDTRIQRYFIVGGTKICHRWASGPLPSGQSAPLGQTAAFCIFQKKVTSGKGLAKNRLDTQCMKKL